MDIQTNADQVAKRLRWRKSLIPKALRIALNDTAHSVREAEIRELHKTFKVRSPWWKSGRRYGFNLHKAKTNKLEAKVFTRAKWLVDHVEGATRIPAGKHRAVPKAADPHRKASGAIAAAWQPSRLKGRFVIPYKGGYAGMYIRQPDEPKPVLAHLLIPRAKIKKTYDWSGAAEADFKRNAKRHFFKAVDKVLK